MQYAVTVLNGLALGAILFLIAVGLSLVFGIMDVLNLAHGAVYLVGAYVAVALIEGHASVAGFVAAVLVAALVGGLAGAALAGMSIPVRGHLDQALLTLGTALIITELISEFFGNEVRSVAPPPGLDASVGLFGQAYPAYRLALVVVGVVVAVGLHLLLERTRIGATLRATVADRQMVEAMGIRTRRLVISVFAAGAALAAVGGVLAGPVLGAQPGLDDTVLLLALVVVVIGGLGSVRGALLGAVLVGQVQALGVALLPDQASFLLFAAMAAVLLLRPAGLLPARGPAHA
ncbi:branched-chain amino acid ABC transporter permease [Nonomuraea sp. NPDC048916]|uniref:branched-chain amino acid ABC transporter permease n=1 Tax=Nonomuraea sp. NPDC048916 TaxID=3154232 RepID=UPI0033E167EE